MSSTMTSSFSAAAATPRAVVLLSGGLDSATTLAMARARGLDCYALSFDYGQRHRVELEAAARVAQHLGAREHRVTVIDTRLFASSALVDTQQSVPHAGHSVAIPSTYVPARNTVMLALGLAWCEALGATYLYIGANAVDYSGYPDCRPEYLSAFENMANLALKMTVEGQHLHLERPLVHLTKAEIIQAGIALGVDYSLTVSCYQADEHGRACGNCDSCYFRREGFRLAGVNDPTLYQG